MSEHFSKEKTINCPQCGDELPIYIKHTKLVQCRSCDSNIFLEDDAVSLSGDSSVLVQEVSLLSLNEPFYYASKSYLPLGKIRYSYGRGYWEEWWLKDSQNNEYWLSIDEGDLVLQQAITSEYTKEIFSTFYLGMQLSNSCIVTELGEAVCEGFTGSLPKKVVIGTTYYYAHLSGEDAKLTTVELINDTIKTYSGKWISSFDIGKMN